MISFYVCLILLITVCLTCRAEARQVKSII